MQQGPFAPQALPCFFATADLAAAVSPSTAFPVAPVIRSTLRQRFLAGTRTVSPVARHVLVTVPSLPPRRSGSPRQPTCDDPCCLRLTTEGSASGVFTLSGPPVRSLSLRPGDSLTIPRMASSMGFRTFGFPPACHSSYGALAVTPVGLTPTEHASLSLVALWSNNRNAVKAKGSMIVRFHEELASRTPVGLR